jgi:hypothetical protein
MERIVGFAKRSLQLFVFGDIPGQRCHTRGMGRIRLPRESSIVERADRTITSQHSVVELEGLPRFTFTDHLQDLLLVLRVDPFHPKLRMVIEPFAALPEYLLQRETAIEEFVGRRITHPKQLICGIDDPGKRKLLCL